MSLRIRNPEKHATGAGAALDVAPARPADDWSSRLAKLIPAEAMALYGAGIPLAKGVAPLWILAIAALFVAGAVRFIATKSATGTPQWPAIGIALVSFTLWLFALPQGATPFDKVSLSASAGLLALIWTSVVPIFYKGD